MLAGDALSSRVLYHGLCRDADVVRVVIEDPVPAAVLIRSRLRRLGAWRTAGQLLFIGANRLLARRSRPRVAELIERYRLDTRPIPADVVQRVSSVNDAAVPVLLRALAPDAVVINGTRIIASSILAAAAVPVLNGHMGITPRYRGVHGAYWALVNGDPDHCGVTVHLVDSGVDTGAVVFQETIPVEPEDDFNTYPIHQIAHIVPLMRRAVCDAVAGALCVRSGVGPSALWHHPTLLGYLRTRLGAGVR